jgi:hypothetical protein
MTAEPARRLLVSVMAGMLAGFIASLAATGLAHPRADFYVTWWHHQQDPVHWHFDDDFPLDTKRARVIDAFSTWISAPGILTFVRDADENSLVPGCPTEGNSFVTFGPMDGPGDVAGLTRFCAFVDKPEKGKAFWIILDSEEPWYSGPATPPPVDELDIQAVATHEIGHATGFGVNGSHQHWGRDANGLPIFPEYTDLCVTNPKHTMCPFIELGEGFFRSLETHDLHTFDNRY